jgi:hypothetical protein
MRPFTNAQSERKVLFTTAARTLFPQLDGKVGAVIELGDILDATGDWDAREDEEVEEGHDVALLAASSALLHLHISFVQSDVKGAVTLT